MLRMSTTAHPDTILIIDFGSQVTQLIARRVREAGVYSEIVPFQLAEDAYKRINPKAVILSGSPHSTTDIGSPRAPQAIFEAGIPVLGICYGEQTMCAQLGGKVESGHDREFGRSSGRQRAVCWHLGQGHTSSGLDEPWRPRHSAP